MIVNVALRNWKFMEMLGVASVRWFGDDLGWFTTLRRQMILDGKETMPLDPDKPTVLTMYNSFCIPGMPVEQQCVAARMKMFSMSYAQIERQIRGQFTKMFGPAGFDADRDIAGITLNRHGHAYVVTPPGFFFGKDPTRFGKVVITASERLAYDGRKPPPCAAQILRPGKRSRVPSKIRCDKAIVVSSGLPIVFVRRPLPANRPLGSNSRVPIGCMKTRTPNSSHLAQNGWNFGLARSSPATLPATPMPRKPSCLLYTSDAADE